MYGMIIAIFGALGFFMSVPMVNRAFAGTLTEEQFCTWGILMIIVVALAWYLWQHEKISDDYRRASRRLEVRRRPGI